MEEVTQLLRLCVDEGCSVFDILFEDGTSPISIEEAIEKSDSIADFERGASTKEVSKYRNILKLCKEGVEPEIKSYRAICACSRIDLEEVFSNPAFSLLIYEEKRRVSTTTHNVPEFFFTRKTSGYLFAYYDKMSLLVYENRFCFRFEGDCTDMVFKLADTLSTRVSSVSSDRIFSRFTITPTVPWKDYIYADVIMNTVSIASVMGIDESNRPLFEKAQTTVNCLEYKFSISLEKEEISIQVSNTVCVYTTSMVASLALASYKAYEKRFPEIQKEYEIFEDEEGAEREENRLSRLRKAAPDLFVSSYSRECPILPIIAQRDTAGAIEYHGIYYAAPPGYYVGLKINRLSNRDKYKYLVTAYKTDHMERKNSITYKYVNRIKLEAEDKKTSSGRFSSFFHSKFDMSGYRKHRFETFIECVHHCFQERRKDVSLNLSSQEFWYMSPAQIEEEFQRGENMERFYRYFEEVYECNIIMLEVSQMDYSVYLPDHLGVYIWDELRHTRAIVVLKNPSSYHIKNKNYYELISRGGCVLIDDSLCKKLIEEKKHLTVRSSLHSQGYAEQYIDEKGKCTCVLDADGNIVQCYSRPLNCERFELPDSVLKEHARYLGERWYSSTNTHYYFPDAVSAQEWKTQREF